MPSGWTGRILQQISRNAFANLGLSIREHIRNHGAVGPVSLEIFKSDSGAELIEIAGRAFDVATPLKRFVEVVVQLEKKYGSRSRQAALIGVDWKSIHHALRLTFEAEDLLRKDFIHLPFEDTQLEYLKNIKAGQHPDVDWGAALKERIERVQSLVAPSQLPESCNMAAIEALHADILGRSLDII